MVRDYLDAELTTEVLKGPFNRKSMKAVQLNRFGVREKKSQPGKWRLIVDLSHPDKQSVNDGISSELCSFTYAKVDDVVQKLAELGPGAMMAKIDVKSAYRIVPVHPDDRHLLGMSWDGSVYIDTALPFGLRSAPKIFTALADALQWIAENCGVSNLWYYLDDYITCGGPNTDDCQYHLDVLLETCRRLGVPLAAGKLEGPTPLIVFLGILIDTIAGELRLPEEKLQLLKQSLADWLKRKRCTKRELLSIAGQLQHAAKVVKPGRTFLRRMFELSTTVQKMEHHVHLNSAVRSDLMWWWEFLEEWNGISLLTSLGKREVSETVISDASGRWGCGAFWERRWFQLSWEDTDIADNTNIATKELIPVVMAAAMWERHWEGSRDVEMRQRGGCGSAQQEILQRPSTHAPPPMPGVL